MVAAEALRRAKSLVESSSQESVYLRHTATLHGDLVAAFKAPLSFLFLFTAKRQAIVAFDHGTGRAVSALMSRLTRLSRTTRLNSIPRVSSIFYLSHTISHICP